MANRGFDYSKWDNIELSDDESDLHPNIDRDSWFRMKHRTRLEREQKEDMEMSEYDRLTQEDSIRLKVLRKRIDRIRKGEVRVHRRTEGSYLMTSRVSMRTRMPTTSRPLKARWRSLKGACLCGRSGSRRFYSAAPGTPTTSAAPRRRSRSSTDPTRSPSRRKTCPTPRVRMQLWPSRLGLFLRMRVLRCRLPRPLSPSCLPPHPRRQLDRLTSRPLLPRAPHRKPESALLPSATTTSPSSTRSCWSSTAK